MNRVYRGIYCSCLLWVAAPALCAQALVVGVRAGYGAGGAGASLSVGDPVNLSVSGPGNQEQSAEIEMLLDSPLLMNVAAVDVAEFRVVFSPPSGYAMVLEGIRRTIWTGAAPGPGLVKV